MIAFLYYFLYYFKLEGQVIFCKLNIYKKKKKQKRYSKTQASTSTPTAPVYSNFMALLASFDSSSITFTRTIKCIIFDPILSCEGHIIRGMRNAWPSCWSSQQTFMLLHDLQNGKMAFCPIAFVLGDDHISEVQYGKKNQGI